MPAGKFNHYEITILYKNEQYKVNITDEIYKDVGRGKLPDLYYLQSKKRVFAPWEIGSGLRLAIVFSVFFGCTFIPIQKIQDKMTKMK
ncbi:MAG: hypothetical protein V4592_06790 [Bacteroidota bacterium]